MTNPQQATPWSYWEKDTWLDNIDHCIVGSGIVGLSCALALAQAQPKAKIVVLERGVLPSGGSTKNAGFACFGSISEVLSDLEGHDEQDVVQLVGKRADGIELLLRQVGPQAMDYERHGGYEVFLKQNEASFEQCKAALDRVNALLEPRFADTVYKLVDDPFGFGNTMPQCIYSSFEGQIHTGKMMRALMQKARHAGILLLTGVKVQSFESLPSHVEIRCEGFELRAASIAIASNGFAASLIDVPVTPARAQALITEPIPGLKVKGTFHLDQGYYYFRNVGERVLFGGGRNLDIEGETTTKLETSALIQDRLDLLLRDVILPEQEFRVAQRWSGIMGVGPRKLPVLERLDGRCVCGVRMCGMGIALGSAVGWEMAGMIVRD